MAIAPGRQRSCDALATYQTAFVKQVPCGERRSLRRHIKAERGIWQRRYWEHLIRDERDLRNHIDYIHFNPVKHRYVSLVRDWRHSSFHRFVREGVLPADWSGESTGHVMSHEAG